MLLSPEYVSSSSPKKIFGFEEHRASSANQFLNTHCMPCEFYNLVFTVLCEGMGYFNLGSHLLSGDDVGAELHWG